MIKNHHHQANNQLLGEEVSFTRSSYYPYMSHYNKYIPIYSLSLRMSYQLSDACDGRGGYGPSKTHFFPHKVDFGTSRRDGGFRPSKHHHTATLCLHHSVNIIQLVLLVVLHSAFLLLVVKVLLGLLPPTLPTTKFIVGLVVVIFIFYK